MEKLTGNLWVDLDDDLIKQLATILGKESIKISS